MTKDRIPEKEYNEIKRRELAEMQRMVDGLKNSKEERVMYRDIRPVTDIRHAFQSSVEIYGNRPFFLHKVKNNFETITYKQAYDDVNALGTALMGLDIVGGNIGIIGTNSYQWMESYLAVIGGVGVVVPLDKELMEEELEQLSVKGELVCVITCDEKYYEMFKRIKASGKTGIKYIINVDKKADVRKAETKSVPGKKEADGKAESRKGELDEDAADGLLSWYGLMAAGREKLEAGDRSYLDAQIVNTDLAVILFTSGTTGVAKGVMLSNKNLVSDITIAPTLLEVRPKDVFFLVLPIHHTYASTASFLEPMYRGAAIAICSGLKYLLKEIEEVRPTFFLGVPVLFENFYSKIQRKVREQGKDKLLKAVLKANRLTKRVGLDIAKGPTKQITDTFGGRMQTLITGGAAIDGNIMDFFTDIGFRAVQGYGLTECSPIVALNPDQRKYMRNYAAGFLLPYMECKIIDRDENGVGEICFKGPVVMMGYYKDKENTDAVLKDGWFHTGDLGYLDPDNYVVVTGRKKNVIITGNGKNVFPEELEFYIMRSEFIEEAMVWGDENNEDPLKRGIYATIRVNKENVAEALGGHPSDAEVFDLIRREVDRVNADLPGFKKIGHIVIRKREFDKTTAMKIRRFVEDNKLS